MTTTLKRTAIRLAAGTLACVVTLMIAAPARSAPPPIERAGTLELNMPKDARTNPANAGLMFDGPNRRAYQLILMNDFSIVARAWNLDTKKIAAERLYAFGEIGGQQPTEATAGSSPLWMHAIDHDRGILYVMYMPLNSLHSFGGVAAFDGSTMKIIKNIPRDAVYTGIDPENPGCTSSSCQPQPPSAAPSVRGMAFLPAVIGGGERLLFLYMETIPFTEKNFSVPWIEQWNLDTNKPVFKYRIQSCSNAQLPSNGTYQLAMFQARRTAGIYLACTAGGGAGQVVRIDLDLNGQPASEASFPGPLSVIDTLADPEEDRILMRVQNEEGESWWAFDGSSSSYTGVIGTALAQVPVANGLDPLTGRLYSLAPPTRLGRNQHPGGLLISDTRRAPVPQALSFPEFAGPGAGVIGVDVNPVTGERLVYARPGIKALKYNIYRDNIPISYDPPDAEQDALTVDVDEAPGVTASNYAGSGHAYGFRAVLVGGLNGAPPAGPDTASIRLGRWAGTMTGSPCGFTHRELIAGAVRNVALSNSLASASSAVADADPSTIQDIGEPSGRCYPRPQDLNGNDVWDSPQSGTDVSVGGTWDAIVDQVRGVDPELADELEGYPRPLDRELDDEPRADEGKNDVDEVAGTNWPFAPVECSGDGGADTDTRVSPLHRGDPDTVPPLPGSPPRDLQIRLERMRAEATCEQTEGRSSATAQMLLAQEDLPSFEMRAPGIGTIRVGDVSSSVTSYLDQRRGLVTRSVAVARSIEIGEHVSIDMASSIGEAWAHGRPGTAATSFTRYLCGVRVRDEAPGRKVHRPVIEPNAEDPTKSTIEPDGGTEVTKSVNVQGCSNQKPVEGQPSVLDLINRALGSRARASAPNPDGPLSQGTQGGYLASVQRDRYEAISSQTVNSDGATQVPALELIVFNDDPTKGRGRQVYQFAGVDASVTYGIYLLNPEENFDDDDFQDGLVDFTGGPVFEPPDTITPVATTAPPGPFRVLFEGLRILLRSPKEALLAAAVWLIFFSPVRMAGRRRALRALG